MACVDHSVSKDPGLGRVLTSMCGQITLTVITPVYFLIKAVHQKNSFHCCLFDQQGCADCVHSHSKLPWKPLAVLPKRTELHALVHLLTRSKPY